MGEVIYHCCYKGFSGESCMQGVDNFMQDIVIQGQGRGGGVHGTEEESNCHKGHRTTPGNTQNYESLVKRVFGRRNV